MVGPKFQGVKMLPPGPHMVSYNATSAGGGGDFAPTVSFFAHLAAQQVVVRRWDAAEELLLPMQDSDEVLTSLCGWTMTIAKAAFTFVHDG